MVSWKRRRRDEAVGGERCLGDSEQQRAARAGLAAERNHALVLLAEAELINLLFKQEVRISHVLDLHPAQHLAHDDFDVLVADGHALETVDFLNLIDQVSLQLLFAKYGKNVMRVERSIHKLFASPDAFAFLHVDVDTAGNRVFLFGAVVGHNIDLALTLGNFTELHHTIDFADDGRFARLAGFKQFDHTRQTAGDVLGLGGFARNLREHIARGDFVAILHHEVSTRGHQITLVALGSLDDQRRLALFIRANPRRRDATGR